MVVSSVLGPDLTGGVIPTLVFSKLGTSSPWILGGFQLSLFSFG